MLSIASDMELGDHMNWQEHTPGMFEPTKEGFNALHFAVFNGHKDFVKMLLKHEARMMEGYGSKEYWLHFRTYWGTKPPVYLAANNGDVELVEILLNSVYYRDIFYSLSGTGGSVLHYAVGSRDLNMVKVLTTHADPVHLIYPDAIDGWTPLHVAASAGKPEIAEYLMKLYFDTRDFFPLMQQARNNFTLLHVAAEYNQHDFAKKKLALEPALVAGFIAPSHDSEGGLYSALHVSGERRALGLRQGYTRFAV